MKAPKAIKNHATGSKPVPTRKKVIDREVVQAAEAAQRILQYAEERAQALLAEARAGAEALKRQAHEAGFAAGLAQWEDRLQELEQQVQAVLAAAKPQILKLAIKIAEKILRRQLDRDPQAIVPILEETLKSVRGFRGGCLVVRVHPDDGPILERYRDRLLERNPGWQGMDIVLDAEMTRGGCCIVTEFGTIDARVETQLKAMEHLLTRGGEA